jgi:hypothetical protein
MQKTVLSGRTLIVLGKGLKGNPKKGEKVEINIHSKMSAIAAGLLFHNENVKQIVFTGGATKGKKYISEARAMKEYLLAEFSGIYDGDVILEEESIDTAENITKLMEQKVIRSYTSIPVLSLTQQLRRSRRLFWNIGRIKAETISAQNVIRKYGTRADQELVREFNCSRERYLESCKELVLNPFTDIIDPKGKRLRKATLFLRSVRWS